MTGPEDHLTLIGELAAARAKPLRRSHPPTTHIASGPGKVRCSGTTFSLARVKGRWFYLNLILEL